MSEEVNEEEREEWNVTLEYDVSVMATDEDDAVLLARARHHSKGLGECYDTGVWKTRS